MLVSTRLDINLTNYMAADNLPWLIHPLGPQYTGTSQDLELVKFLTYEASTSLSISSGRSSFVRSPQGYIRPGSKTKNTQTLIVKALREGMPSMGLKEDMVAFIIAWANLGCRRQFGFGLECIA